MKKIIVRVAGVCIFLGLISFYSNVAKATTYAVSKTTDTNDGACDSDCSLREAIGVAIDNGIVNLPAGTYSLNLGDISITRAIVLSGAGAGSTIIDGQGLDRIFDISGAENINVTIKDVTITNGRTVDAGGAIRFRGALSLFLQDSIFTNNTSTAGKGGAIDHTSSGTVAITNCTFSGNTAATGGGAVNAPVGGTLISYSTFYNNSSTTIGGGIAFEGSSSHTIVSSTISGNSAIGGDAGGIWAIGSTSVTILNCTITNNTSGGASGGIYLKEQAEVTIENSILAGNAPSDCFVEPAASGNLTSSGHNIFASVGCPAAVEGTDIVGSFTLGSYQDDGSPGGGYHPLTADSSAINAGNSVTCTSNDQLGRPRFGTCDIGAGEAVCGDSIVHTAAGEECDDGNSSNLDVCSNSCLSSVCGDGYLQSGEECDDGGTTDGNGCSGICLLEEGYNTVCGDAIITAGEGCDDGNTLNGDGCNSTCSNYCGNGEIEESEECDDGVLNSNLVDGACRDDCRFSSCGDGMIDLAYEECDDGDTDDNDGCDNECYDTLGIASRYGGGTGRGGDDGGSAGHGEGGGGCAVCYMGYSPARGSVFGFLFLAFTTFVLVLIRRTKLTG